MFIAKSNIHHFESIKLQNDKHLNKTETFGDNIYAPVAIKSTIYFGLLHLVC